ncbi:MAG: ankyrin repeat domain-containing protein [Verrucomicrobiales bacterium]|nr:ankyrin repeat domain-containing protein [Verrucomicrobiales bacterium]
MDSRQALVFAILEDRRGEVKRLLQRHPELAGCPVAEQDFCPPQLEHWVYQGDTGLHLAAAGYRVEILATFLAAGAEASACADRRRSQPIHYTADGHRRSPAWDESRQAAAIRILLDAGANRDAQDENGATPLHRAVRTRCAGAVNLLLRSGATPTIQNRSGSTPFHLAVMDTGRGGSGTREARLAQGEIVRAFLEHGVLPTLKDAKGRSVLESARSEWIRRILTGGAGEISR